MLHSYRIFRTWTWEIFADALAIALVFCIAVLIASFDKKPVPNWGERINLNALLALLSTILRAMLVVIVSQIISQRKWEWFKEKRTRPLSDLQRFDTGSRGSLGALLLIPIVLRKDMVTLLAAIILLASWYEILVGPFVQQASRTMECTFAGPGSNASLPFAHYVPRHGGVAPVYSATFGVPAPDIVTAILSSVTAPNGVENQISASCTTGNCTFPRGDPRHPQDENAGEEETTTHSTVGMCSQCIDVNSLIRVNETEDFTLYTLPDSTNVSYYAGGSNIVMIQPTRNLTWLGDMLTPGLRAASRWAYVNVTFLTLGGQDLNVTTAAACTLYPYLRTYSASLTNNELSETEMKPEVMKINMNEAIPYNVNELSRMDSRSNFHWDYVVVKSPCRVDGATYTISQNASSYSGGTKVDLFDFTDEGGPGPWRHTIQNITAPEQCIYRHDSELTSAISTVLRENIFVGTCSSYKGPDCHPFRDISQPIPESLTRLANHGVKSVLLTLYNDGNPEFSIVLRFFNSFADAMTNRFRFQYGAAYHNGSRPIPGIDEDLPPGEIQGVAWQSTVCVSMRKEWLLLPLCLTVSAAGLSIWTIVTNWRQRHSRPVWKDSILPLIFYSYKIESQEPAAFLRHQRHESNTDPVGQDDVLLEASEMDRIGRRIPIKFWWPDNIVHNSGNDGAGSSSIALKPSNSWLKRRSPQTLEVDSLLETNEGSSR